MAFYDKKRKRTNNNDTDNYLGQNDSLQGSKDGLTPHCELESTEITKNEQREPKKKQKNEVLSPTETKSCDPEFDPSWGNNHFPVCQHHKFIDNHHYGSLEQSKYLHLNNPTYFSPPFHQCLQIPFNSNSPPGFSQLHPNHYTPPFLNTLYCSNSQNTCERGCFHPTQHTKYNSTCNEEDNISSPINFSNPTIHEFRSVHEETHSPRNNHDNCDDGQNCNFKDLNDNRTRFVRFDDSPHQRVKELIPSHCLEHQKFIGNSCQYDPFFMQPSTYYEPNSCCKSNSYGRCSIHQFPPTSHHPINQSHLNSCCPVQFHPPHFHSQPFCHHFEDHFPAFHHFNNLESSHPYQNSINSIPVALPNLPNSLQTGPCLHASSLREYHEEQTQKNCLKASPVSSRSSLSSFSSSSSIPSNQSPLQPFNQLMVSPIELQNQENGKISKPCRETDRTRSDIHSISRKDSIDDSQHILVQKSNFSNTKIQQTSDQCTNKAVVLINGTESNQTDFIIGPSSNNHKKQPNKRALSVNIFEAEESNLKDASQLAGNDGSNSKDSPETTCSLGKMKAKKKTVQEILKDMTEKEKQDFTREQNRNYARTSRERRRKLIVEMENLVESWSIFKSVVVSSSHLISVHQPSKDALFKYASHNFQQMFGKHPNFFVGKPFLTIVHKQSKQAVEESIDLVLKDGVGTLIRFFLNVDTQFLSLVESSFILGPDGLIVFTQLVDTK